MKMGVVPALAARGMPGVLPAQAAVGELEAPIAMLHL
jgi:hypothetical protein